MVWNRFLRFLQRARSGREVSTRAGEEDGRVILQEEQKERFEHDMSILAEEDMERGERLEKEAEREVVSAAEDSLKRLHVIQRGRCPTCGDHLHKHLFATVCDACGWHTFDTPRNGPIRIHLKSSDEVIDGERCYEVKGGTVLVITQDVVMARIPADSVNWIEYLWDTEEISERRKQVVDQMGIRCGWCNGEAEPEVDGFHLVHVALGGTQERYCLCSDVCYEAFRKMYPARVHRNCYERNCTDCDLCVKRYGDEAEGLKMLAKDHLTIKGARTGRKGKKA